MWASPTVSREGRRAVSLWLGSLGGGGGRGCRRGGRVLCGSGLGRLDPVVEAGLLGLLDRGRDLFVDLVAVHGSRLGVDLSGRRGLGLAAGGEKADEDDERENLVHD